jgi:adenosylcobinamide kinase / adenosylcobinamide-phosphate guanylyltransferase
MAGKMIFITGGCRSGKSRYALDYANRHFSQKVYLATGETLDEEMARRVEHHRRTRGPDWQTVEEPLEIANRIRQYGDRTEVILVDCLTLWLSNLLMKSIDDEAIMSEVAQLIAAIRECQATLLIVSNEVGMGIVPAEPLARRFRDLAGMANQRIAEAAETVIFMVSGMPLLLKGGL